MTDKNHYSYILMRTRLAISAALISAAVLLPGHSAEACTNISVTCIAPTKAFNIAGIQTAAVMIPNEALHHKVWRALNTDVVADPNVFAIGA